MDILRDIETQALALRGNAPSGALMEIDDIAAEIELPMERPLYTPAIKAVIANVTLEAGELDQTEAGNTAAMQALYSQVVIDKAQLIRHIGQALQQQTQVSLFELCQIQPLQHGLAELVAYLQLAGDTFKSVVDEATIETVHWQRLDQDGQQHGRQARLPRIIFVR